MNSKFDIIGISSTSFTFNKSLKLAGEIKNSNRESVIVFGGPHISIEQDQILEKNSFIDFAIYGEGEYTLLELIQLLERDLPQQDKRLKEINGLIFRAGKKIVINPPREWISSLDSIPFPAYELFKMERYDKHPLLTSRGCPFNCIFFPSEVEAWAQVRCILMGKAYVSVTVEVSVTANSILKAMLTRCLIKQKTN